MMRTMILGVLALGACGAQSGDRPVYDVNQMPAPPQVRLPADDPALSYGSLDQDIRVVNLTIRPLAVIEDSRCPQDVDCVWSGQLVLRLRVSGMAGDQQVSSIRPLALPGGGTLELASVWPLRYHGVPAREPYRFGFRRR